MTNVITKSRICKKYDSSFLKKILFFAILSLNVSFAAISQQVTIKGKVIDDNTHEPIAGAVIRLKGTTSGAATDVDGAFQLLIKQPLPITIVASFAGYKDQEVEVYENEAITISIVENLNKLSEVVVVGYGTQKREELTGSVTSVSLSALKQSSSSSFDNALQGRASGVQVTQSSGSPGGAVSIRVRGGNSITGGNEPLYVIDGFPVYNSNSDANAGALNGPSINALSAINPNDIESIDVLKDASATAIYGSRGANGVVMITTKKGKAGAAKVTYDGSYGVQTINKYIDLLNAKQWGILKNDARANSGKAPLFSSAQLDSLGSSSNDWQRAAFRSAAVQSHNLAITGGTEKSRYSLSLGYLNQDGILLGTDFKRFTGRLSLDSKITEKLSVGVNINGSSSDANVVSYGNASGGDIVTSLLYMPPTVPIYDASGNYTFKSPYESAVANPIATLNLSTNTSKLYRLISSAFGEYAIVEGLKVKILFGADVLNNKQNRYLPSTLFEGVSTSGYAAVGTKNNLTWLNENTINYAKTFNKDHNIEALAGYTQQYSETEGVVASSQGFVNNALTYNDLYSGSVSNKPSSSYTRWGLQSFLARLNYNYSQKYFLTASFRADGSSRLGKNNRWGYFPSASVAWQVNKELFFKPLTRYISNFKLRFSAGTTGNQEIAPYQSLSLLSPYPYATSSGTSIITGYAPARISNPDLKWETTAQYDLGLDLGLLKDRIRLIADVYYKKTSDLLLSIPVPTTSGFSYSLQNIGEVENKGIELGLNTDNIKGKFTWNTDITFSLNRNKVLSLGADRTSYLVPGELQTASIVKVGQPLGSFWGYKANGIFKASDDIANTPRIDQTNTKPGDVRYVDVNKDGVITQAGDQTLIGNAQPKFIYGIGNSFSYKNFDLSIFFQGSYGSKIYSTVLQQLQLTTGYQNGIAGLTDHYTADNQSAQYPRANENVPATPVSDLFVYDGSYVRLKTVTLGYNLPKRVISKIKISNLRVYVSGQNLKTWASYPGYDPEVNYYDQNQSRQGVDASSYPNARTITGGVSITF